MDEGIQQQTAHSLGLQRKERRIEAHGCELAHDHAHAHGVNKTKKRDLFLLSLYLPLYKED